MPKTQIEMLDDCQAKLAVKVEPDRLQQAMAEAAGRIAGRIKVPGFRPGKAPYQIIARHVGEAAIYEDAIETLGQVIYGEALQETGLKPYAPGTLDNVSREPCVFSFTVPLAPKVELGSYRKVRVKLDDAVVTPQDVQRALESAQEQQATLESVQRAIELEDIALLDIKGVFQGDYVSGAEPEVAGDKPSSADDTDKTGSKIFIDRKGARVLIAEKAEYPVPKFFKHVLGMSAGDTRNFEIVFSNKSKDVADDLRGKTIAFEVSCKEVFKRELPDLDDDFAISLGDYRDLADLKAKLELQLIRDANDRARDAHIDRIFDKLLDGIVDVRFPPVVVEEQIDHMLEDFEVQLRRQDIDLETYLKMNGLTVDEMRSEFHETAAVRVTRGLILGSVSEAEQIEVSDAEIADEIQTRLLSFGAEAPAVQPLMSSPEARQTIASRLLTEKTIERLIRIARGDAPDLRRKVRTPAKKTVKSGKLNDVKRASRNVTDRKISNETPS